jgi:hypothetical protein
MDLTSSSIVNPATAAASASAGGDAQTLMLKKALDSEATQAAGLIDSLPRQPALATQGNLGTNVNTYA